MIPPFSATPAERRLLTEGRLSGPMPWVIAIMMFLTVLAAAGGLALNHAASNVTGSIAQRITVQIVEANPDIRESYARGALFFPEERNVLSYQKNRDTDYESQTNH